MKSLCLALLLAAAEAHLEPNHPCDAAGEHLTCEKCRKKENEEYDEEGELISCFWHGTSDTEGVCNSEPLGLLGIDAEMCSDEAYKAQLEENEFFGPYGCESLTG